MMRHAAGLVLSFGLCLTSGCATAPEHYAWSQVNRVVEPVSYAPHGSLKVFTKTLDMSTSEDVYYPHSPYAIYTEDGTKLRRVENHSSREDREPTMIVLPPGKYVVVPSASDQEERAIGVVIEDQRLTEVRLKGGD